jgi:hypothetical protein
MKITVHKGDLLVASEKNSDKYKYRSRQVSDCRLCIYYKPSFCRIHPSLTKITSKYILTKFWCSKYKINKNKKTQLLFGE